MSGVIHKRQVGKEVMTLLKDHSPLTLEMLHRMTEPRIQKKNLRQAIGIMRRKGLIDMIACDHETFFYQLHQALPVRREVAMKLGCALEKTERPLLRRQDWIHNEWCEFWSLNIKRTFPEVEIIREHDIDSHNIAKNILQQNGRALDLMPDFLMIFPKTTTQEKVSVAFEIERTRKSNARIQNKLKTYIYETHIDGLIYVCDSGRLSETIRLLYERNASTKAHKKRGYADHFFLFSNSMSAGANPIDSFYNAGGQPTSLMNWCQQLRATKQTLRRDLQFQNA